MTSDRQTDHDNDAIAIALKGEDGVDAMEDLVDRAKASGGDLVLLLDRIGAAPYMRFTPYENNRGVTVNMWSCVSVTAKAMPERTILMHPRIVDPSRLDDYNVRMFTTPWVRQQVNRSRIVRLFRADDTPFAGDMLRWNDREVTA